MLPQIQTNFFLILRPKGTIDDCEIDTRESPEILDLSLSIIFWPYTIVLKYRYRFVTTFVSSRFIWRCFHEKST